MTGINTGIVSDPVALFGGVKESGFGREGGRHGMEDFQSIKARLISSNAFQIRQTNCGLIDDYAWRSRCSAHTLVMSIIYAQSSLRAKS